MNYEKVQDKAIPVAGREGSWGSETSRLPYFQDYQLTDGGEVIGLPVRGWVYRRVIIQLGALGQLKNPMTSTGFEAATFRFVA
jgi:hypothetical protein